jgi:two-component system phosphate regulon response regulator PhoB
MGKKVAVVEDEAELASLLEYNLERNGFTAHVISGARETMRELEDFAPDLILLDVMLPETDGFDLCRRIRQHTKLGATPILFLTARAEEVDRVLGLELGGDDYVTKPFSIRELIARVKAHLRRREVTVEALKAHTGPFELDREAHRVFLRGKELELTSTEFRLLEFFLSHPGKAYSRDSLLNEVWGESHFVTPRTVDVHIRRLREQIEEKAEDPKFLVTVRGFGYRFEQPS